MCVVWYLWLCVPCGVCGEVECSLGAIAVGPCSDRLIQIQGLIQKHSHVMQVHTRRMRDQILQHTESIEHKHRGGGSGAQGRGRSGAIVYVCVYCVWLYLECLSCVFGLAVLALPSQERRLQG